MEGSGGVWKEECRLLRRLSGCSGCRSGAGLGLGLPAGSGGGSSSSRAGRGPLLLPESCPEQPAGGGGVAAAATQPVKSSDRPPSHLSTVPPSAATMTSPAVASVFWCLVLGCRSLWWCGCVWWCGCTVSTPVREPGRGAQRHTHSPAAADCDRGATCYCVTPPPVWQNHTGPTNCVQSSSAAEESTLSATCYQQRFAKTLGPCCCLWTSAYVPHTLQPQINPPLFEPFAE